jgi:ankyrin repeat protein
MREARYILVLFLVSLMCAGIVHARLIQTNGLYGGLIVNFAIREASLLKETGGSGNHLINNKEYRSKVESAFREREQLAHNRKEKLFGVFKSGLSLQQEEALKFLFAYMPLSDLANYNGDFFLANANIALRTRQETPWGKSIPENIFLHYVLPCRIVNENLDPFRIAYYDEIRARVKGMDATEAALEINHWCHEKVSYQTIAQNRAPMTTILSAHGRCGATSIFVAAALRTAGIPARYVGTRWVYSDGDHAWVEVWIDGKWHYMEACHPEPVLDWAWFTEPASREMWICTLSFGAKYGQENTAVSYRNCSFINTLSNYAVTKTIKVKVLDANNLPVKDARVEYLVYMGAWPYRLVEVPTDEFGISKLETGLGSLLIWARKGDDFNFKTVSVNDVDTLNLILNLKPADNGFQEMDFSAPIGRAPGKGPAAELVAANTKRVDEENAIRQTYINSWMKPEQAAQLAKELGADPNTIKDIISRSMGNYKNIASFLTHTPALDRPMVINLLKQLPDKLLIDITEDVLTDHVTNVIRFEKTHGAYDYELYSQYVLNPSIRGWRVFAWRKYLLESLPAEFRQEAIKDPSILIKYVKNNIVLADDETRESYSLAPRISPKGVHELKVADSVSRDIYFVALCRSLGIPSRIDYRAEDNRPQFYFNKEWHDVLFAEESQRVPGKGFIRFSSDEKDPAPEYLTHFTIARFQDGHYNAVFKKANFQDELAVPPGHYMLVTANRVNDSRILSTFSFFELKLNEHKAIDIKLRRWSRNTTGVALYIAAWSGDIKNVKRLIQEGSEVDRKDEWGWTALHWAVRGNHKEVAEFLIAQGANVGAKGEKDRTPLHIAAEGGQKELAEMLIAKGADVNAKDDEKGRTPLHIAVISNQKELAEVLIARGADVDGKEDEKGRTALHKAAEGGFKELSGMLIAKGADVNAQDDGGGTPLNCAIWNDHIDVVKLLLTKGADVNVAGRFGWTALHDAAWLGRMAIAELLIAKGAKVNAQAEKWARTPLDAAISQGHTEVAELIRKHGGVE